MLYNTDYLGIHLLTMYSNYDYRHMVRYTPHCPCAQTSMRRLMASLVTCSLICSASGNFMACGVSVDTSSTGPTSLQYVASLSENSVRRPLRWVPWLATGNQL